MLFWGDASLEFRYDHGIPNIANVPGDPRTLYNRSFAVLVGFQYGSRRVRYESRWLRESWALWARGEHAPASEQLQRAVRVDRGRARAQAAEALEAASASPEDAYAWLASSGNGEFAREVLADVAAAAFDAGDKDVRMYDRSLAIDKTLHARLLEDPGATPAVRAHHQRRVVAALLALARTPSDAPDSPPGEATAPGDAGQMTARRRELLTETATLIERYGSRGAVGSANEPGSAARAGRLGATDLAATRKLAHEALLALASWIEVADAAAFARAAEHYAAAFTPAERQQRADVALADAAYAAGERMQGAPATPGTGPGAGSRGADTTARNLAAMRLYVVALIAAPRHAKAGAAADAVLAALDALRGAASSAATTDLDWTQVTAVATRAAGTKPMAASARRTAIARHVANARAADDPAALLATAREAADAGEPTRALVAYEAVGALHPDSEQHAAALLGAARAHEAMGATLNAPRAEAARAHYDAALAAYEEHAARHPRADGVDEIPYRVGNILYERGYDPGPDADAGLPPAASEADAAVLARADAAFARCESHGRTCYDDDLAALRVRRARIALARRELSAADGHLSRALSAYRQAAARAPSSALAASLAALAGEASYLRVVIALAALAAPAHAARTGNAMLAAVRRQTRAASGHVRNSPEAAANWRGRGFGLIAGAFSRLAVDLDDPARTRGWNQRTRDAKKQQATTCEAFYRELADAKRTFAAAGCALD